MTPVHAPPVHDPGSLILAKMHIWANDFFLQLPNLAAALVFVVASWWVAKGVSMLVRRLAHRRERRDLGDIFASISFGVIMILALMVAAAIVFPSVKPGNILSALGVGSVAVGFAFKDILQNLFAGILLLLNRPFKSGDQIKVKDFEGTVEHIWSRATLIKTYDGRQVIIPNADIYTSPVIVNTAFPIRQDFVEVGIGYGDDPAAAADIFTAAITGLDGVEPDPAPSTIVWDLGASQVTLRVRWWVSSVRKDMVLTRARVVLAVHEAAGKHGIDLPFPTSTILLHDQTDAADGDRRRQREGWPAGEDPPAPAHQEKTPA